MAYFAILVADLFKHCCVISYCKFKINSLKLTFRPETLIDLSLWQKKYISDAFCNGVTLLLCFQHFFCGYSQI